MLSRRTLGMWSNILRRTLVPSTRFGFSSWIPNPDEDYDHSSGRRIDGAGRGEGLRPDWKALNLTELNKSFYEASSRTLERTPEEIEGFRSQNEIQIVHGSAPPPTLQFEEVGLPDSVLQKLVDLGYKDPMPIQAQGWPIALSGKDVIAIGETGSGKTLGFLLPALLHIKNQKPRRSRDDGPIALILAPTRELASQIHHVVGNVGFVKSACLVGGSHKSGQLRDLSRGADIVVATPGRLIDLLEGLHTNLQRCSYVVLDEADRMLDMGFEPQIRRILQQVRPDKQILLWSATWPEEVRSLVRDFISEDYIHMNIGSTKLQANKNITQKIIVCESNDKDREMFKYLESLEEDDVKKILVFAETKVRVDRIVNRLNRMGYNARGIHSDKSQANRTETLNLFRKDFVNVLVATNVASRGLDVNNVRVVINYDHPNEASDYVHRIGRTGRQGHKGKAMTLFTEEHDGAMAKPLADILRQTNQEVPTELESIVQLNSMPNRNKNRKKFNSYNNRYRRNSY